LRALALDGTNVSVTMLDDSRGRIARASIWVLLALSVPYALMMVATGIFFGLWNAANPLLTAVWALVVTSPVWLAIMLAICRRNPRRSIYVAIFSWLAAGLLLTYIYG
jgi:high-affinity Fe2+/Pb2+ permease